MKKHYLAVDLGASSGRTIVGTLEDGKLSLKEINRFWNGPTEINGTLFWDFVHLFRSVWDGIEMARREFGDDLVSMGIDTWGVDFGLIDVDGKLIGNPVNYRDPRTRGMFEKTFEIVPKEEVFEHTGVQFMELNTLYQLMSLKLADSAQYKMADKLLFSPDLLGYWFTGHMVANRTIASTSQFYDPSTNDWSYELLEKLGLRTDLFPELVDPGTKIGELEGLSVISVGSHDTASAFAAVPVRPGVRTAFLSSGTWSLLGTELSEPIINADVLENNFTNEVGVAGTVRFLRNLSGLWIIQEMRRNWHLKGYDYSWNEMAEMALLSKPFEFFIDPSDESFLAPGDMAERIKEYCTRTGQPVPEKPGQILRAAYEGLAMLYADTFDKLETLCETEFEVLRIVGGGCRDKTLNQFAANATGRKVITGPFEATAIGNLIVQMLAVGDIASLEEGRSLIRESFANESEEYLPQDETAAWRKAMEKWNEIRSAN